MNLVLKQSPTMCRPRYYDSESTKNDCPNKLIPLTAPSHKTVNEASLSPEERPSIEYQMATPYTHSVATRATTEYQSNVRSLMLAFVLEITLL